MDVDRLPPNSSDAEEAVLGSILIDPSCIGELDFLRNEHFYNERWAWVLTSMRALRDDGLPIDFVTVTDHLRNTPHGETDKLDRIGGESAIIGLINAVPTAIDAIPYAKLIQASYFRRKLIQSASQIANMAYANEFPVEQMFSQATQLIGDLALQTDSRNVLDMSTVMSQVLSYYERAKEGIEMGIPTGFTDLDKLIGGLNKSDLIVVGARPGMGKTALASGIATAAASHGHRPLAFYLEMSALQIGLRALASHSRVPASLVREGKVPLISEPNIMESIGQLSAMNILVDDSPGIHIDTLVSRARQLYYTKGIDLVLTDYAQLIEANGRTRQEEVSEISRKLKGLARELDIPVITTAQLSRGVETRQDKHPQLADLRESGCLTGDTMIPVVDTGEMVRMDSLIGRDGFRTFALDESSYKIVPALVTNAFSTGTKPVFEMTTQLGRKIKATANHKFRTFDGWNRLDSLSTGDSIATSRMRPTLRTSDVYWDRVVSIEYVGDEEVYDLTVEKYHNFIANGVFAHNSLEQDADIVMFIYRDEYYNPATTERPNIAEITVAKHRNGPTGTIDLYWHSALATFRNLQRQSISFDAPSPWENKAHYDAENMDI